MAGSSWTNQVQNQVIVGGLNGGVFVYSGTPGQGDLISSITAASSDPFGNATLSGNVTYFHAGGGVIYAFRQVGLQLTAYSAATFAGPFSPVLTPLAVSVPSGATTLASGLGAPQGLTPAGLAGSLPLTQTDTGTNTNAGTDTGNHRVTALWTIPAGDALSGTEYVIEVPYTAVMEGNNVTFGGVIDLAAGFSVSNAVAGAIVGAGIGIEGTIRLHLKCVTTGAAGTFLAWLDGSVAQRAAALTFANSGGLVSAVPTVTLDTTVSHTLAVSTAFAAVTAGQSFTGYCSTFTRQGP